MPWWSSNWAREIQEEIGRESRNESDLHDAIIKSVNPELVRKLRAYVESGDESPDLVEEIQELHDKNVKRILARFMSRRR
jgi:hypothetical protein